MCASRCGYLELVLLLLRGGAKLEATDNNGRTALLQAASVDNLSVVTALLDAGARREASDNNGIAVLCRAAINGHIACVRALLDRGAAMDAKITVRKCYSLWYTRTDWETGRPDASHGCCC